MTSCTFPADRSAGPASLRFLQDIRRGGAAGCASQLPLEAARVACVDARSLRPKRLPAFLVDAVTAGLGLMGEQLSILRLVAQASVTVQVVIGILPLASARNQHHSPQQAASSRARREADRFETRFWSGDDLAQPYRSIEAAGGATGMAGIFELGFRECRLRLASGAAPEQLLEGSRCAMRAGAAEGSRPARSTTSRPWRTGSTSPFVGPFGYGVGHQRAALGLEDASSNPRHGGPGHF